MSGRARTLLLVFGAGIMGMVLGQGFAARQVEADPPYRVDLYCTGFANISGGWLAVIIVSNPTGGRQTVDGRFFNKDGVEIADTGQSFTLAHGDSDVFFTPGAWFVRLRASNPRVLFDARAEDGDGVRRPVTCKDFGSR